jgi:hypothetical protein
MGMMMFVMMRGMHSGIRAERPRDESQVAPRDAKAG